LLEALSEKIMPDSADEELQGSFQDQIRYYHTTILVEILDSVAINVMISNPVLGISELYITRSRLRNTTLRGLSYIHVQTCVMYEVDTNSRNRYNQGACLMRGVFCAGEEWPFLVKALDFSRKDVIALMC